MLITDQGRTNDLHLQKECEYVLFGVDNNIFHLKEF